MSFDVDIERDVELSITDNNFENIGRSSWKYTCILRGVQCLYWRSLELLGGKIVTRCARTVLKPMYEPKELLFWNEVEKHDEKGELDVLKYWSETFTDAFLNFLSRRYHIPFHYPSAERLYVDGLKNHISATCLVQQTFTVLFSRTLISSMWIW